MLLPPHPTKSGALGLISLLKMYKTSQIQFLLQAQLSLIHLVVGGLFCSTALERVTRKTVFQRGLSLLNMCSELVVWRYRDRPGKGLQKPWKEHSWRAQAWARILGLFYPGLPLIHLQKFQGPLCSCHKSIYCPEDGVTLFKFLYFLEPPYALL